MTIATSTLEESVAVVMRAFGDLLNGAVGDATAIFRAIYGIADGNDYGRYFAGQNPLVPFASAAISVAAMISQGVVQRESAATAITAAIAAASGDQSAFVTALLAALKAVRQSCANPGDAVRILTGFTGFDMTVNAGSDAVGTEIATLAENASVLIRRASAVSLSRASADYVPSSQQDAATVRDQVADAIDDVATEAGDLYQDESYKALNGIRVAVVEDLNRRGGSLAPVVTRTFGARMPASVLAYRLYQDASRAGDLLARNDPPHPSFMPTTVEALAS